jgi:uncharacterized protein with GYD domain
MPEYLVLMKLNPNKIIETLDAIRNTDDKPLSGVNLRYSMNIFGSWDVAVWINADNNSKAADFVQKKIKDLDGVTEIYTVPTFPHGNNGKNSKEQNPPLNP